MKRIFLLLAILTVMTACAEEGGETNTIEVNEEFNFADFTLIVNKADILDEEIKLNFTFKNDSYPGDLRFNHALTYSVQQDGAELEKVDSMNENYKADTGIRTPIHLTLNKESDEPIELLFVPMLNDFEEEVNLTIDITD